MPSRDKVRRGGLGVAAVFAAILGSVLLLKPRPAGRGTVEDSGRGAPGTPPSRSALRHGYEVEDIGSVMVGKVLISWAGIVIVVVVALILLIDFWHDNDSTGPLTPQQAAQIAPPAPNLQPDPYNDLSHERALETARLHGYAWTDDAHTRARIPIGRAMQLVTGRSLEPAP